MDETKNNIQRELIKSTGVAVASLASASAMSGTAVADDPEIDGPVNGFPYDYVRKEDKNVQMADGSTEEHTFWTLRNEKDQIYSDGVLGGTTTVEVLNGTEQGNDYVHTFRVSTHGVGIANGNKERTINSHAMKFWQPSGEYLEIFTPDSSDVTGVFKNGEYGDAIDDVPVKAVSTAVGLANNVWGGITAVTTIVDNILDTYTEGCSSRDGCVLYDWGYSGSGLKEVTYTTEVTLKIPKSEYSGNLIFTSHLNNRNVMTMLLGGYGTTSYASLSKPQMW